MNIGLRIKEARAKASGRANIRRAKQLQNLKAKRIKAEGKANLRKKRDKEINLLNKARGGSTLDKLRKTGTKFKKAKNKWDKDKLSKLKREIQLEKLRRQRDKLKGSSTKKQIITIGNGGGGGLF